MRRSASSLMMNQARQRPNDSDWICSLAPETMPTVQSAWHGPSTWSVAWLCVAPIFTFDRPRP
eukprot:6633164-Alexandrium_andersonii.AAC.1